MNLLKRLSASCLPIAAIAVSAMLFAPRAEAKKVSIPPEDQEDADESVLSRVPLDSSPYVELGEEPGCVSLRVNRDRLVVRRAPNLKSKRRGVVREGSFLPALERLSAPGCKDYWYRIHEQAWVCGKGVTPSDSGAWGLRFPVVPEGETTPWPYAFVRDTAIEYRYAGGDLEEVREVFKGYGFAVDRRTEVYGEPYFRTVEGRLIPRRAAGIAGRISEFQGQSLGEDQRDFGWVNSKKAYIYDKPKRKKVNRVEQIERYEFFRVEESKGKGRRAFFRIGEDRWLSAKDVRVSTRSDPPEGIGPTEKWIDVDLSSQITTAYEGDKPIYATMVSTGRGGGSRTIRGEFRIWVKVSAIPMDNTDEELEEEELPDGGVQQDAEERHLFSLHDVPWSQFFYQNYALHGVYWHDRFGNRRSHGCVNLAPRDARWFYDWTEPRLPDGWWAIYASEQDQGTLVRVR